MNRNVNIKDAVLQDFLDKYLAKIDSLYSPQSMYLFGSRVYGSASPESDIDMVLVSASFNGKKFVFRMGNLLKNIDYPKHIDAICYTPEEFAKKRNEIGLIRDEVLAKGIKIL